MPPLPWLDEGLRALALLIDPQLPEPAVVPPWLEAAEVTRWNASHWDASHWYASRWYQFWDERLALLAVVLYAVFVQPLWRPPVAALLAGIMLAGLVTVQVSLQVVAGRWLPMDYLLCGLVISYVVMALWRSHRMRWKMLAIRSHNAHVKLAREYLSQNRLEEALEALAHCMSTHTTLETYYELGLKQETKRQYQPAIQTYERLLQRQGNYKDVKKRLAQLNQFLQPGSLADNDLGRTMVLDGPLVSLPELGRYQVEREIGRGAMGVVYLGHDPKIGRRVAIKTLTYAHYDPSTVEDIKARFYREAEAAGRLNHPNIVTVYDVGEEDDLAYIAMDYAEGESLSRYSHPDNLLPVATVYQIVAEVADALDYAHRQNVVHRDIKPGNLIFNPQTGQLKVTDFGIARITDSSNTRTGEILGSPIYLSPELLKGEKADGATDIYSLGVSFYQLLTGQVPFHGDNVANVAYQIVNSKYKSVRSLRSELPSSAVRIVNKAMHRDPDKRFATAGEMADEIRRRSQHDFKMSA